MSDTKSLRSVPFRRPNESDAARKPNTYPSWSPRFWHGMRLFDYFRLHAQNRCRIHPLRWAMAVLILPFACANSIMSAMQQVAYGRRIADTPTDPPPVFVLGHWRSGTTMLHELLSLDDRLAYPSTYQCFAPHHFLVSNWIFGPMLSLFVPARRPMDDMPAGVELPQEDEFALCSLGAPTPYRRIAYVNHGPVHQDLLDFEHPPAEDLQRFRAALVGFVKSLMVCYPGRPIVLKSPPHTGRIRMLAEWFPGARFVHLARHPYSIVPSTIRLWNSLDAIQGFQLPRYADDDLVELIMDNYRRMYGAYFRHRQQFSPQQLAEIRYEDLLQDPLGELERIYDQLNLGDFSAVRQRAAKYLEDRKKLRPGKAVLSESLQQRIDDEWGEYFSRFGYQH